MGSNKLLAFYLACLSLLCAWPCASRGEAARAIAPMGGRGGERAGRWFERNASNKRDIMNTGFLSRTDSGLENSYLAWLA